MVDFLLFINLIFFPSFSDNDLNNFNFSKEFTTFAYKSFYYQLLVEQSKPIRATAIIKELRHSYAAWLALYKAKFVYNNKNKQELQKIYLEDLFYFLGPINYRFGVMPKVMVLNNWILIIN
jgi:hypothetical protein